MIKKFENMTNIDSRELFDRVSDYCDELIDEATSIGALAAQNANNEYTREIGRVGRLCADYEDTRMQFQNITMHDGSPLKRVRDAKQVLEYA